MAIAPTLELKKPFPPETDTDFYPSSDGKPMSETDAHWDATVDCAQSLKGYYDNQPLVYVASNNFLYYEEGNPKKCVSPDLYVVFGVEKRQRDSYFVWRENGQVPVIVFEFTSRKTRREDVGKKFQLYEQVLRVPEYILFDVKGEYLKPSFQGYRLQDGVYVPIERVNGRLYSEQLGLDLVGENQRLRLFDPLRGEWLRSFSEEQAARYAAEERAKYAQAQALHASRLANREAERANREAEQARREAERAQQEAERANNAETEIARLQALLATLQQGQTEE